MRYLDRLHSHVLQSILLHPGPRPFEGSLQLSRTAKAGADLGSQISELLPTFHVGERRTDDSARYFPIAIG